ncbi:MAG: M1 family metallopeptidase [Gemmatimonadota bacterium]|jgi:hypothetical protein
MTRVFHLLSAAVVAAALLVLPSPVRAQTASARSPRPERAVRLDIPLEDPIRRAFAAGTRDSTGAPGPAYWQLQVDYAIEARLEPETGMVYGSESVRLHNTSPDDLSTVVLRLDQNVFRPDAVRSRGVNDLTEGTVVKALAVDDAPVDLTWSPPSRRPPEPVPGRTFIRGLGTTSATLFLSEPIPAGSSATLDVEWEFRVPRAEGGRGLRMGAWGDSLFQVAQWYPQVARYDDLRGWDTEPYLGGSEFYHNFGTFDVSIDVPAGWPVGATGVLQNPEEVLTPEVLERLAAVVGSDETRTIVGADESGPGSATLAGDRLVWRFRAERVNDFAWATSRSYVWEATGVAVPGAGRIPFHWMYLPGHADHYARADVIGRHAVQFYSELLMPYAFPVLTMVDGPDTGMEYPMLVMSAMGAEDHEIGHEWWPMMVGTDETRYGFMDEGFNVAMGGLSRADAEGEEPDLDGMGQSYGRTAGDEAEPAMMWNANYAGPMYRFQTYQKAPLMLSMLGGIVGDDEVWRAMSDYARAWRFKHPSPWDWMFFMNRALDRDLGWFWNAWLFTTGGVEGSIQDVTDDGSVTRVTVRQDGPMPSPVVLEVELAEEGPPIVPMDGAEMLDERTALVRYPVDVWFPGGRTFVAALDFGGRAVTSVTLDPHGRFPDGDPTDNVWPRAVSTSSGAGPR